MKISGIGSQLAPIGMIPAKDRKSNNPTISMADAGCSRQGLPNCTQHCLRGDVMIELDLQCGLGSLNPFLIVIWRRLVLMHPATELAVPTRWETICPDWLRITPLHTKHTHWHVKPLGTSLIEVVCRPGCVRT